jgi:hypothetical protein
MLSQPSPFTEEIPPECLIITDIHRKKTGKNLLFGLSTDELDNVTMSPSPGFSKAKRRTSSKSPSKKSATSTLSLSSSRIIRVGDTVTHKIFGKGKVLASVKSAQPAFRIAFQGGVVKTIASKFLHPLD